MPNILEVVNQRTQLVGQNRLEMLLFKLNLKQTYGINVFKVKEVIQCPELTEIPKRNPVVRGVAHIRNQAISILDLNAALGGGKLPNIENCFVVIAEYNRVIVGFLVKSVVRIVNLNWADVQPPPSGLGETHYLTAITRIDNEIIEIIDVEKVMSEITPPETESNVEISNLEEGKHHTVLVIDDSSVARNQVKKTVTGLGLDVVTKKNGKEALEYLYGQLNDGINPIDELLMVISDIEMPEMDGYTFTTEVKSEPSLSDLHVMLHTSLSGGFNQAMVKKVKANDFLAKYNSEDLAKKVKERVDFWNSKAS